MSFPLEKENRNGFGFVDVETASRVPLCSTMRRLSTCEMPLLTHGSQWWGIQRLGSGSISQLLRCARPGRTSVGCLAVSFPLDCAPSEEGRYFKIIRLRVCWSDFLQEPFPKARHLLVTGSNYIILMILTYTLLVCFHYFPLGLPTFKIKNSLLFIYQPGIMRYFERHQEDFLKRGRLKYRD